MVTRGELLELLVDSDQRWTTLHCRLDVERAPRELPAIVIGAPRTGPAAYDVVATARPFRVRLTLVAGDGPDAVVDDGEQTWVRTGDRVQELRLPMGSHHTAEVRSALQPRRLVAQHDLELLGERDGALRVLAGATGELLVDATTGVLLSQRYGPAHSVVLTDLRYDDPVASDEFAALAGAHVEKGLTVPARYAPGLVLGVLLAAAGGAVGGLVDRVRRRLPGSLRP